MAARRLKAYPFISLFSFLLCCAFASCSSGERRVSRALLGWSTARRSYHSSPRSQGVGSRPRRATWDSTVVVGRCQCLTCATVMEAKKGAAQPGEQQHARRGKRASVKHQQGQGKGKYPPSSVRKLVLLALPVLSCAWVPWYGRASAWQGGEETISTPTGGPRWKGRITIITIMLQGHDHEQDHDLARLASPGPRSGGWAMKPQRPP